MISDDYRAYGMNVFRLVRGLFTGHTFFLLMSQRIGNWMYRHHIPFFPDVIKFWQLKRFSCELSPYATIGEGLLIQHSAGIVVGHEVVMGHSCELFQNVTIGSNRKLNNGRYMPILGNHVTVYAGAVVVGGIQIGNHVTIGANSFVNKDIPDYAIVVGNPARIVSYHDKDGEASETNISIKQDDASSTSSL